MQFQHNTEYGGGVLRKLAEKNTFAIIDKNLNNVYNRKH
jgi:hypothetical protein